ncbi:MAG: hypothetical protein IT337_16655 [Thermomicrobiales bacterium]|nr:hypothetical protein [Thermomicrobiales bacterium]
MRAAPTSRLVGFMAGGVLALVLLAPTPLVGAQATPQPTLPVIPKPEECRVAPRPLPLFSTDAATATPVMTPGPLPTPFAASGALADAATTAAITATVRESLACRNAGELRRAYALLTDGMLAHLFGNEAGIPPEVQEALADPVRKLPRAARLELLSVSDPVVLPDGRVAARVETRSDGLIYADDLIFTKVGDHWLIDEAIPAGRKTE